MDSDIEQIHNVLLEANLPSSIDDLKNPTEEFVVNLITTFLRRFYIDVSAIDKPTMEQQNVMLHCEETDIIGLINLHIAMVQICDRIYIKDLCITDIISPGLKRIRKQAKFLANFILYATNKESDIQDKINEIQNKAKMLQDMLEKKNELLKSRNDRALHTAKQLSLKDKYIAEIKNVQSKLEKNKKQEIELTTKLTTAERKKQDALELCRSYKAQARTLSKTISELQSKIVKSPERYKNRLNELEKQQDSKVEERTKMEVEVQDKKHSIEQKESILNFIKKQLEKFGEVRDINEKLKKINEQEDTISKQVKILRGDVKEFEIKLKTQKNEKQEKEIDALQAQCEERLSPLRSLSSQLLSEKKLCKEKLEEMLLQYNTDSSKLRKTQSAIKKLEEETAVIIKNYQELYDKEILNEKALRKTWTYE
ncbi:uncharacterized protein LOC143188117 [Calliopsis andreniformis]|uniref:uncharacterized protein LOC143188117 n=1 Tax=Calliopsis andreniformis TaxID=337506 RepID=UPI003FCD4779